MEKKNDIMHIIRPNITGLSGFLVLGSYSVKISYSTYIQILECISRQVLTPKKRIIGTLMGIRSDDGLEYDIRYVFVVPYTAVDGSVVVDESIHKSLFYLYKKSHSKESVLGWFSSAQKLDKFTALIHDFYTKGNDTSNFYPAIHLNIDYLSEDGQIMPPKVCAYIGASFGKHRVTKDQDSEIPLEKSQSQKNFEKDTSETEDFELSVNKVKDFLEHGVHSSKNQEAKKQITESETNNENTPETLTNNNILNPKIKSTTTNTYYIFVPVHFQIVLKSPVERLMIQHMKRFTLNEECFSLESNNTFLNSHFQSLSKDIDKLLNYIDSKFPNLNNDNDIDLLRILSKGLFHFPYNSKSIEKSNCLINTYNQDLLMLEYLVKSVQEEIELSARLTSKSESEKNFDE